MNRIFDFVLGSSRLTSVIGLVLGAPGIADAAQQFGQGQAINVRSLISNVALVLLGRFAAQTK
jgi:hypothetical protein